jgi:hypothetical protein
MSASRKGVDMDISTLSNDELYALGKEIGRLPGLKTDKVLGGILASHQVTQDPKSLRSYGDWHLQKACEVFAREDRPPLTHQKQVEA